MTVSATSGVPVSLIAQFESDGTAAAPELPLVLTITPAGGDPIFESDSAFTNPTTGIYIYVWTPPVVTEPTDYVVRWDPAGDDVAAVETATVYPASSSAWATIEQTANQTGVVVTAETLALASSVIDTFSGADPSMPEDAITAVDRRHLRKATSWQAVFMANKPGMITERENASSITSDSQNIQREDRADIMLAPLARRELMSVSWIGTRTKFLPPASPTLLRGNFLNESSDPGWLGGRGAIPT